MARTSKYTHKGDTRRSEPVAVYGNHHDPSLLNPGADPDLDPETERTALNATDTIRPLDALVEWVGAGKPATSAGYLKPALVPELAAALGVELIQTPRSMKDSPVVATSWTFAEALELISGRHQRGRHHCAARAESGRLAIG
ncbi:hypothetical protein [Gordonia bronchialis]|uniref:hypothetical protein n=1 Tax=Gordonia bronchialis TaxID=2054 RepID=UPI00242FEC1E|nr:hypothetical protein [Gordonia bronchialis]